MAYPIIDTFSDAEGTILAGTGVAVNGSGETDRLSASGSKLKVNAGTITAYGIIKVSNGAAYQETGSQAPMVYVDNAGAVGTEQVTGAFRFYTATNQTYIALILHNYYQLRYYFVTTGSYTANRWYIVDSVVSATPIASFIPPSALSFGTTGSPVDHAISYKLTGDQPATTGYTAEVIVDGVTLGWSPNFTSAYPVGNQYPTGWVLGGVSVATPGAQTGIHLNTFVTGTGSTSATSASIAGPAVCGVGIATPASYLVRGLVSGEDAGVFKLSLVPPGGVLVSNATFALSDASGGTFSGTNVAASILTIPAGDTAGYFSYTPASSGNKTITATPGGAAAGFAAPTFATVATNRILMLDGDSLTDYRSGNSTNVVTASNLLRWSVLLQKRLGTTAAVYNFAASGQGVGDQIADFASEIQPKIQAAITAGATVYFVQYGAGNSVNQVSVANPGFTTTQVGNNIAGLVSSLCTSAKNLNAKVIVLTYPRRKNDGPQVNGFAYWQGVRNESNFNAALDVCNAAIRTGWQLYANAIIDWGNEHFNLNPEYTTGRQEDGTHPYLTSAGVAYDRAAINNEIAAMVFGAYRSLELGGGSASGGGGSFVFGN